ncbi:hypothetical protein N9P69_01105 [Gammaproteobacteria bacterium]|jgi:hypothetical protein|nr:hypothetical protein [Gammaproteobacteria bacterium]
MANSTFSGPVRSENGFKTIDVATSTGAITDGLVINADGNIFTDDGGHIQYAAATGYGPADFIVGKGGSQYGTVDPFTSGLTQLFPLGSRLLYGNTVYAYGRLAAVAVTAGKCVTHAAKITHHFDLTPTAGVAAGETAISVETAGTDITLNQYANGYLYVNDAAGEGQMLRIKSNPAHDHSADPSIVITCYDDLATAITTSSRITLIPDPRSAQIVQAATTTGATLGVTVVDMAASAYGWFAVSGPQAVLTSGTLVVGNHAVPLGAAGAVGPAAGDVIQVIGTVMIVNVTTDYSLINLTGII